MLVGYADAAIDPLGVLSNIHLLSQKIWEFMDDKVKLGFCGPGPQFFWKLACFPCFNPSLLGQEIHRLSVTHFLWKSIDI